MCTFGFLWLSCETPAASGPPGLHTTTRELKTYTFDGPGASKHHQKTTRRPPERQKDWKWSGRGKKSAKFWAPPFAANCETTKTLIRAKTDWPKTDNGLAKNGLAQIGFGQNCSNQDGQKRSQPLTQVLLASRRVVLVAGASGDTPGPDRSHSGEDGDETQFAHHWVENHRRGLVVEVAPNVVDATAVELPSSPHASVVDALEFQFVSASI